MRQEKRTETITYIVDESYRIQYMSKALMNSFRILSRRDLL